MYVPLIRPVLYPVYICALWNLVLEDGTGQAGEGFIFDWVTFLYEARARLVRVRTNQEKYGRKVKSGTGLLIRKGTVNSLMQIRNK